MMTVLDVPRIMTIDTALEWISDDELVSYPPQREDPQDDPQRR